MPNILYSIYNKIKENFFFTKKEIDIYKIF